MIQVIERFHKLIEYVSEEPERPHSLTELAGVAGVSVQACSNIIRTMVKLRYLESAGERKGYILGSELYYLTRKGPFKKYLAELAEPYIDKLSQEINEFLVLVVECGGRRLELLKLEPDSMIHVRGQNTSGTSDLFRTATGLLMLAYKPEEEFRRFWENRDQSINNLAGIDEYELMREKCTEIVRNGYYVSEPEIMSGDDKLNGSCTMSFPIVEDGKVIGALGSRVPMFRFEGDRRERIIVKCIETAALINTELKKSR